jgi:hypothetical protein
MVDVKFSNVVDSRLRVLADKKPEYELPVGIKSIDFRNLPSQNASSQTGTQYTLYLNENQILSDYLIEEAEFEVTFNLTCTDANVRPFLSSYVAPRVMPLTNSSQNIAVTINGQTINVNPQDMMNVMLAFNKHPDVNGRDLPCCSTLDTYTDLAGANPINFETQAGSLKNPLLDYFTSTYSFNPRVGDVEILTIENAALVQNEATNVKFKFRTREPVFSGVTSLTHEKEGGFIGASIVQLNRSFVSNVASRCMNYLKPVDTVTINSVKATISNAKLYYQIYTPDDSFKAPASTFYPILDYGLASQTLGVSNNKVVDIVSQTLSLDVVPRCIYVWVAKTNAAKTNSDSDSPGWQMTSLNVSYNGVGGQFSSITSTIELYEEFMARQGCIKSFTETGFTTAINAADNGISNVGLWGSCFRIDASNLAGIPWDRVSVGSQFSANLQVKATARCLAGTEYNPTMFIQVVNDRVLEINGKNSAIIHNSIIDSEGVKKVRQAGDYSYSEEPMLGGNIFKKLALKLAPIAVNKLTKLGEALKRHTGKALLGEALKKHKRTKKRGGASYSDSESEEEYEGGAYLPKYELIRRLK